jgi:hypothetical protein
LIQVDVKTPTPSIFDSYRLGRTAARGGFSSDVASVGAATVVKTYFRCRLGPHALKKSPQF